MIQIRYSVVGHIPGVLEWSYHDERRHRKGSYQHLNRYPATGEWLQLGWDQLQNQAGEGLGQESITFLELLPIVLACGRWGHTMEGPGGGGAL